MDDSNPKIETRPPNVKAFVDSAQKFKAAAVPAIHSFMAKAGPHARTINTKVAELALKAVSAGSAAADKSLEQIDAKIPEKFRPKAYPLALIAIMWVAGNELYSLAFEGRALSETIKAMAPVFLYASLKGAEKMISKFKK